MQSIRIVVPLAILLALADQPRLAAQASDAGAVAVRVQQRYNAIRDFAGDFVQSYEGGVLRTKTTERGTFAIKRPGRMRWVYTTPERKEFVSDGVRIYSYLVTDKQVIVSPSPGPGDATTPALFLSGGADLGRDFTASFTELPAAARGLTGLRLQPKQTDADYQWIGLGLDSASLQVRYLVAVDRQGGRSAFTFSNLKENRGLADTFFEFHIPRGVDVVSHGARPR